MPEEVIPALANINRPRHLIVKPAENFETFMKEVGWRSFGGNAPEKFFGTAFIQGSRLQFTTAMPIQEMVKISKIDRSKKKDSVEEVMEHSNRPEERTHAKHLRSYLLETACQGDTFIFPAFTFNYGVDLDDDDPDATLMLLTDGNDGTNAWPAILLLPHNVKLDTTDGAHRKSQIQGLLEDNKLPAEQKEALKRNAVDVKIVFEDSRVDSHQDFADCGKAKPIAPSLVTTYDVRDKKNERTRELVRNVKFLSYYVDATASNVNLSAKSRNIWSMNAVRMFVAYIVDHYSNAEVPVAEKTKGAEEFFEALIRYLPQLRALEEARKDPSSKVTTGSLRDEMGGDVALRGVGMAIFARAFRYCLDHKMDFEEMAKTLARVEWSLLTCSREDLLAGPDFGNQAREKARPHWANLLITTETRYRVRSSSADVDDAWRKLCAKMMLNEVRNAA